MKVVAHIHTSFSFDTMTRPEHVVRSLAALQADLALVCDHDSFEGSRHVRRLAEEQHLPLCVPIAAEVATEFGDVIVAFDVDPWLDVRSLKRFEALLAAARRHAGVVILPHPFVSHTEVERLAHAVDAIEVFNARCSRDDNDRSAQLCADMMKARVFACDAHFAADIGLAVAEYDPGVPGIDVFRGNPRSVSCRLTPQWHIAASTLVGNTSRRRLRRLPKDLVRVAHRYLAARRQPVVQVDGPPGGP